MKYSYLAFLIIVWWAGAGIATVALFFQVYNDFLIGSIIGWAVVVVATGLIFFEMKRIKAEDKKKEELKG